MFSPFFLFFFECLECHISTVEAYLFKRNTVRFNFILLGYELISHFFSTKKRGGILVN